MKRYPPGRVALARALSELGVASYDFIRDARAHLVPIGRLDMASTGLLLCARRA